MEYNEDCFAYCKLKNMKRATCSALITMRCADCNFYKPKNVAEKEKAKYERIAKERGCYRY